MTTFIKHSICVIILFITAQNVFAHKDHSNKPAMPAIGIVQGTIIDSVTSKPIEYASVSLVDLEHNELVTGGLTDKNGLLNITEIPLGKYVAVIEFIGYEKKELNPIILFPGEGGGIRHDFGTLKLSVSAVNMSEVEVLGD